MEYIIDFIIYTGPSTELVDQSLVVQGNIVFYGFMIRTPMLSEQKKK